MTGHTPGRPGEGRGRVAALLELTGVEVVDVVGARPVRVRYLNGQAGYLPPAADSAADLVSQLQHLGRTALPPRVFDADHPTMAFVSTTGARVAATQISRVPCATFRFRHTAGGSA